MKLVLGTGVEFSLESSVREFNPRNEIEKDRVTAVLSSDITFDQARDALVADNALIGMFIADDENAVNKLDGYKLASLSLQQFEAAPGNTQSLTATFYKPFES